MSKKLLSGFTLAELLIALAILGVISAFAIPKILSAQQNEKKEAVTRETLGTIMAILHQGRITGYDLFFRQSIYH